MSKSLLAYFKSENDAESARASLQRLRVTDLHVEQLSEKENRTVFIPFFISGSTFSDTGDVGGLNQGSGMLAKDMMNDDDSFVTHLLEGRVEESDYEEAIRTLSDNHAYSRKH